MNESSYKNKKLVQPDPKDPALLCKQNMLSGGRESVTYKVGLALVGRT